LFAAAVPNLLKQYGISSAEILNLNILIYMGAYILSGRLNKVKIRQSQRQPETVKETLSEAWGFVREVPSFRYLMLGFLLCAAAITIWEFHFLNLAQGIFGDDFQTKYSLIRLLQTVFAIILQTFITSRLLDKLGLKTVFMILPLVCVAAGSWILAAPLALLNSAGGWLVSKLTLQTVDESARKSLQSLVPEERRGRVSMFMDSYLLALGVIVGCIIAGVILTVVATNPDTIYLVVAAGMSVIGVLAILRMRAVYDASMFNWRLKRRQHRSNVLEKLEF
jgi:ATP:ADP antiporter, AAA family